MTSESGEARATEGAGAATSAEPSLPSFPVRVGQVFFSPGTLLDALALRPAWAAAVVLGAVLVVAQTLLIPAEVWDAMFRDVMLRRAQAMPAGFQAGGTLMRVSALAFGTLGYFAITFLFAGIVTLVFAFVLGDEGRYRQYLAVTGHAWLIPAFLGLLLVPLRIIQQDPQLTFNVGTFLYFLPEGYLATVAKMLDLSQAWAWLVVARGAHAIAPRRSFESAAVTLMVLFVIFALLFALIPGVA